MSENELIEDRLEKLAHSLRTQGAIHGPERDLMVDAAILLRLLRAQTLAAVTEMGAPAAEIRTEGP